jgi:hydroxyquinol 1,2-dioxygenase
MLDRTPGSVTAQARRFHLRRAEDLEVGTVTSEKEIATSLTEITEQATRSFEHTADPRLREILESLVAHLHAFARDVNLQQSEWEAGIAFLTAVGHITDDRRQEFILLSDTLGLSALVDAMTNAFGDVGGTESTVLGPFYVADSPHREFGASTIEQPSGTPCFVHGVVQDALTGVPIAGAVIDVWQNGADRLYAAQYQGPSDGPDTNLRGMFASRDDGSYAFVGVRPTDYTVPTDGPVGRMFEATSRHAWRPAHLHLVVSAPGYRTLTTHIFDSTSARIDSDTVFAVKRSLIREFVEHDGPEPGSPPNVGDGHWVDVTNDLALVPV